jgi:hypothetical protein
MKPPPPTAKKVSSKTGLQLAIEERDEILRWLKDAKEREIVLRRYISGHLFPAPKEGVNRIVQAGIEAKLMHKITRKIVDADYEALEPELLKRGVPLSRVVETERKLVLGEYRKLNAYHRKHFDRVLFIKPSETPDLEINT